MSDLDRRSILAGAALAAGATVIASEAGAQAPRMPFTIAPTLIPIAGSDQMFPVRRIYCIGRNYAAHAREMGSDPTREPPFFFQKPTDAIQLVPAGGMVDHAYPSLTKNYHYEVELVVALKGGGKDIAQDKALELVFGYAVGLDMTRRDLQRAMGDQKKPWEIGTSSDRAAPLRPLHTVDKVGHIGTGRISLAVNGTVKQDATLAHMIWNVAEQISKLSEANELFAGDIIYSGTPENVGPVVVSDILLCKIEGLPDLSIRIV